ncbi:FecCD family ABC transporter permease [Undibacterium sp. TJN19]|uniref:FecCD family ABC transporter permease n=1 Tax=Undibacterium sp. TJN19 TaxID=3413055 RepID=UPI003BF18648
MSSLALLSRPVSLHLRPRSASLLALLLATGLVLSVQWGAVPVSLSDWKAAISAVFSFGSDQQMTGGSYVLWNIRLPRALFAIAVGAAMGLSGALTQGLFRNPLADPSLLGVTAGGASAAALTIVVLASFNLPIPPLWRMWLLPFAAFFGAVSVCFALDRIARWLTPGSITGLLLTGMALNAMAAAIVGLCTYLATDEQLRNLSFWTLGSLSGGIWTVTLALIALLTIAWWRARHLLHPMNALALGEAAAAHVGVDVRYVRGNVILIVAVLTGFTVAWCGMISFIGLIAPHMVRALVGSDQRQVIPQSMLVGGLLLLVADTLARTVVIPAEIPVGIFTAILGSPFFLILLRKARGRIA